MTDEKPPCPECGVRGGHKMSCNSASEPIKRMRAKLKAGVTSTQLELLRQLAQAPSAGDGLYQAALQTALRFEYGGRDEELAYLRDAIAKETDPETRASMRERLEYVERTSDEKLHQELTGRPRPS